MAKIIKFPSMDQRIAEESVPAVESVMKIITKDAIRHLQRHHPELLRQHGVVLISVWSAFILNYIGEVSLDESINSVGKERYNALMEELSKKK
jgi:hypothetical protein